MFSRSIFRSMVVIALFVMLIVALMFVFAPKRGQHISLIASACTFDDFEPQCFDRNPMWNDGLYYFDSVLYATKDTIKAMKSLMWDFWKLEFAGEGAASIPSSILAGRSLETGKTGCVSATWLALMVGEARNLRVDAILVPGHMFFRVNGANMEPNREGYHYSDEEYRQKYADGSWSGYEFRPLYKKQFLGLVAFNMGNYYLSTDAEVALGWYKMASELFPAFPGIDKNRRLAIEKVDPREKVRIR